MVGLQTWAAWWPFWRGRRDQVGAEAFAEHSLNAWPRRPPTLLLIMLGALVAAVALAWRPRASSSSFSSAREPVTDRRVPAGPPGSRSPENASGNQVTVGVAAVSGACYASEVPRFEPFAGLRYAPDRVRLDDVVAPPYDVISPEARAALQSRSAYNSVRIELPDEAPGLDGYHAAAHRLTEWEAAGILRRDARPAMYGYRMTFADDAGRERQTVGVIGALGLEPPGGGSILPHEHTTPKARSDRLELLRVTKANVSPIWGLSPAVGLSALLEPPAETSHAVDTEGVAHDLWPITDAGTVAALAERVASAPVLIADGHHRFETAVAYQAERREALSDRPGPYDLVMALIVELADERLSVRPVHRLISGLPVDFDVAAAFDAYFEMTSTDPVDVSITERLAEAGAMALTTSAGTWLLMARPHTVAASRQDLDSSRLEVALGGFPGHHVVYQDGWATAARAVETGQAQAAVLLNPVTVEQIAAVGHGGERMPPKTTFFWPKPRTGLVIREVQG